MKYSKKELYSEVTLEESNKGHPGIRQTALRSPDSRNAAAVRNVSTNTQHIGAFFYVTTSGNSMLTGVGDDWNASGVWKNSGTPRRPSRSGRFDRQESPSKESRKSAVGGGYPEVGELVRAAKEGAADAA